MNGAGKKRADGAIIISVNLFLVAVLIAAMIAYISDFQKKLYNQNVNDISHINQAAANIASEFFSGQEEKLGGIRRYLQRHELSLEDLLSYIDDTNADPMTRYELIGTDYKGYTIEKNGNGSFAEVDYKHLDYKSLQKLFENADSGSEEISFTSEFTDQVTGLRSFARYTYVCVDDGSGEKKPYTLMAVSKTSGFVELINIGVGYNELSTVLINSDGKYILRNSNYKAEDFFEYIYIYNDLTLDKIKAVQNEMLLSSDGVLEYRDSKNRDCVFVYKQIPGTMWMSVTCVPVSSFHNSEPDFTFTVFVIVILGTMMLFDFIWLNGLNRRLKQSADEARSANEAKTDFLARMSHDIRTPINVITGMTELALQERNPPETDGYLENIRSSGAFLLGLVNDILDMNKVESGKIELHLGPYPYSEFKKYINAVIRPLCTAKGIDFTISGNADKLVIVTDSLRMNQIFFNLLSNSVKFTNSGGKISVCVNVLKQEDGVACIDLSVEDTGIGMSSEFQSRMFSAFSQEEKAGVGNTNGTGLGLAIVKKLVELMGGTIDCVSKEGEGTKFTVHLEAEISEEASCKSEAVCEDTMLVGKRILLFEDHPLNIQIMTKLLQKKSIIVDKAENGQIGLDMFIQSENGYYDAILMDIRMPVMNGLEATAAIRALSAQRSDAVEIPIIALTANAYDSDVQSCIDAGMNAHLAKPIDTKLLYMTLCGMLDKEQDKN